MLMENMLSFKPRMLSYWKHNALYYKNMKYDKYLSFPCYNSNNYGVNKYIIENIHKLNINNIEGITKDFNEDEHVKNWPIWYQHPEKWDKEF